MPDEQHDPIIFELAEDGTWTHRYGPAPEGYGYRGKTVCCERPVYKSVGLLPYQVDLLIEGCCDTPGLPKPVVLPPYTGEHATCRKCGSKAVETKYTQRQPSPYGVAQMGYPPEWLARRCTACQATRDEATVPPVDGEPESDRHRAAIVEALGHLSCVGTVVAGATASQVAVRVNAARDVLRKAVGQ